MLDLRARKAAPTAGVNGPRQSDARQMVTQRGNVRYGPKKYRPDWPRFEDMQNVRWERDATDPEAWNVFVQDAKRYQVWPRVGSVVAFFEGVTGEEHLVRKEWLNNVTEWYEGPQGDEALRRKEWHNGTVIVFDGPRGEEEAVLV